MPNWRLIACLLICLLTAYTVLFNNHHLQLWKNFVYNTTDITQVRQWIAQFHEEPDQLIPVVALKPTVVIEQYKVYDNGYIFKLQSATPIYATSNGFVLFTGHMPKTFKTVTVQFDNGILATFGLLKNINFLPYSTFQVGKIIAEPSSEYLYVSMEYQGQPLKLEKIMEQLSQ